MKARFRKISGKFWNFPEAGQPSFLKNFWKFPHFFWSVSDILVQASVSIWDARPLWVKGIRLFWPLFYFLLDSLEIFRKRASYDWKSITKKFPESVNRKSRYCHVKVSFVWKYTPLERIFLGGFALHYTSSWNTRCCWPALTAHRRVLQNIKRLMGYIAEK